MRKALLAILIGTVATLATAACGQGDPVGTVQATAGAGPTSAAVEDSQGDPGGGPSACDVFTEAEATALIGGPVKKQDRKPAAQAGPDTVTTECGYDSVEKLGNAVALHLYQPKNADGEKFNRRMVEEIHKVTKDAQEVPGYGEKAMYSPGTQMMLILDDGVVYQLIRFGRGLDLAAFTAFADVVK